MDTHVKIVAVINIVFGAIGLIGGLIILVVFGGAATIVGTQAPADEAMVAVPVLGGVGILIALYALVFSIPALIGGIGLLNYANWARILIVILSAIGLLNFPIGTLIGIYSLWALLSNDSKHLFDRVGDHQTT